MAEGDGPVAALPAVVGPAGRVHHGSDRAGPQRGPHRGAGDFGAVRPRARVQGDPRGQRQGERGPARGQRGVRAAAEHPAGRVGGQQLHRGDVGDAQADRQVPGGPAGH